MGRHRSSLRAFLTAALHRQQIAEELAGHGPLPLSVRLPQGVSHMCFSHCHVCHLATFWDIDSSVFRGFNPILSW